MGKLYQYDKLKMWYTSNTQKEIEREKKFVIKQYPFIIPTCKKSNAGFGGCGPSKRRWNKNCLSPVGSARWHATTQDKTSGILLLEV